MKSRMPLGARKLGAVEELPGAEDQRRTLTVGCVQHASQEHHVIAAVHGGLGLALEGGQAVADQRAAAGAALKGDGGELVVLARGKVAGERFLLGPQDADAEMARARETRKRRGLAVEAPQHQRWFERDRGEGIGGKADEIVFGGAGRDHDHAGGKPTERLPEADAVQNLPGARDDLLRHAIGAPVLATLPARGLVKKAPIRSRPITAPPPAPMLAAGAWAQPWAWVFGPRGPHRRQTLP